MEKPVPTENRIDLRTAVDELAEHIEKTGAELAGQIESASEHFALRVDEAARELEVARHRIRRSLERLEEATTQFARKTRRPRAKWVAALDDARAELVATVRSLWDDRV